MIPRFPKGFSHPVQIGLGGYGSVYRARQDALNRLVALKFIVEKNAAARAALIKEASMQARLHIQGIPQVYDVKEVSGQVCLIMQWIKGCSLRAVLERELAPHHKYALISEIIKITASLHEREYAHRDIKPENILVSAGGVFFIDFGLALHVFKDPRQTMANVVKGTPEYIAPELWRGQGRAADLKRADVYSMGKVILEIAGAAPLPESIRLCLQKTPDLRPRSAVDVLRQWQSYGNLPAINWRDIAEPCSSEVLAKQIYDSAQALLNGRRREEAYHLLVECLQTCPEFPEALELMTRFPMIKKRQTIFTGYKFAFIGSLLSLLCLFSVFVLLKRPSVESDEVSSKPSYGRSLFMPISQTRAMGTDPSLPFKEEGGPLRTLNSNLTIVSHPETGGLFIDGKRMADVSGTLHLSARNAGHRLIWRAGNGSVVWKQIVTALPFETKRICIKER